MATEEQTREQKLGLLDEPEVRVVKHGAFWHHVPEDTIVNGIPVEGLIERLAFHGDVVEIHRKADLARGEQHDAFYTEEELKHVRLPQVEALKALAAGGEPDAEDVNLHDLDDEELGDWMTGTGVYDAQAPATVEQVKAEVGDDSELAARVLDVEKRGQNRKTLVDHLEQVATS